MRIEPNVVVSPISQESPRAQTPSAPPTAPAAASVVQLSAAASHPAASTQPAINMRVEKIRAMLQTGEFPVDLDELASRIVDDETLRSRTS